MSHHWNDTNAVDSIRTKGSYKKCVVKYTLNYHQAYTDLTPPLVTCL